MNKALTQFTTPTPGVEPKPLAFARLELAVVDARDKNDDPVALAVALRRLAAATRVRAMMDGDAQEAMLLLPVAFRNQVPGPHPEPTDEKHGADALSEREVRDIFEEYRDDLIEMVPCEGDMDDGCDEADKLDDEADVLDPITAVK